MVGSTRYEPNGGTSPMPPGFVCVGPMPPGPDPNSALDLVETRPHLGAAALQFDHAPPQHVGTVGDLQRLLGVLFDDEHGSPAIGGGAQCGEEPLDDHRGEAEREFIDEQQRGSCGQRAGEDEHLLLTTGEETG